MIRSRRRYTPSRALHVAMTSALDNRRTDHPDDDSAAASSARAPTEKAQPTSTTPALCVRRCKVQSSVIATLVAASPASAIVGMVPIDFCCSLYVMDKCLTTTGQL